MKPIPPLRVLTALLLTLLSLVLIGVGGRLYFNNQRISAHRLAEEMLSSVADLKTNGIAAWMKERRGDAAVFGSNAIVQQLLDDPENTVLRAAVGKEFEDLCQAYDYDAVALFDAKGVRRLVTKTNKLQQYSAIDEEIQEALRARKLVFVDIHRDKPDEPAHLSLIQPIGIGSKSDQPAKGAILLVIDPRSFLYPLMQSWPTPSKTAETMLVRREGSEVVFLNELRHQKNTELTLRLPLRDANRLPAAMAVLGTEGVADGIDYRGVQVLAATRKIQNTPWFMVAKVDQAEIYAAISKNVWMIALVVALSLVIAALGMVLLWRQHALEFTQRELAERKRAEAALRESATRLSNLSNNLPGGMTYQLDFGPDGKTRQFTYVSAGVEKMHEITAEAVMADAMLLYNQIVPEDRAIVEANEKHAHATKTHFVAEARFRLPSGRIRWCLLKSAPLSAANGHLIWDGLEIDITDRKQAEEALRREMEFGRTLIQSSPAFFVAIRPDGTVRMMNEEMLQALGYAEKEVLGRDYLATFVPEADRPILAKLFAHIVESRQATVSENTVVAKDGRQLLVEWRGVPVFDGDRLDYFFGLGIDITERKRMERDLEVSRSNLAALLESTDDLVWSVDLDLQLLTFNSRLQQHFNKSYGTEARHGATSLDFLPPERAAKWPALYRRALNEGPYRLEYDLTDGRTLELSFNPVIRDGVQSGVSVFGKDITARKQAEAQVTMLRQTIDVHPDGAYWLDTENKFVYMNDAACQTVGYTREELIGHHASSIAPGANIDRMEELWRNVRANGSIRTEGLHRRKDGTEFPVELTATHIQLGAKEYICGFTQDITERKRAEQAIRESERRFRTIIERSPIAIALLDMNGRPIVANASLEKMVGYSAAELAHMTFAEFTYAEDAGKDLGLFSDLMEGRISEYRMEKRYVHKQGALVWGNLYVTIVRDENGLPREIIGMAEDITERKRAEQELTKARSNLSALIESSDDQIWAVDTDYRVLVFNRATSESVRKTFGTEPRIGMKLDEIVTQDRFAFWSGLIERTLREGTIRQDITTLLGLDMEVTLSPIVSEGKTMGVSVFSKDITARKRAAEAVRESERRLSTLLSNLPGMAYRRRNDNTWTMEFVSEGARTLTGYPPEDIIDDRVISYAEIVHPDDRVEAWRQVQEALERQTPFILHYRIRTASGEERWIWEQGRGIFNEGAVLTALEGFAVDITKLRRAENEVRTLVQNAPVGIASITHGHFTEINDTLCEMLGYSQLEMLQRDVRSFFSTEADATRLVPDLIARIARGELVEQEIQARKKDGALVDLLLRIAPFDPANPAGRSVVIVLDVTARKRALAFEEAKTKAEAANRAKSGFLANMSHEIRTPLNAILGFCQLLQREPALTPQQREQLNVIGRNGEHLLTLINSILEMSKIEANRVTLENKPIDLRSLLGDLEASFAVRTREKGLTLALELNEPLPPIVEGDSGRFRQILFNLLGNAVKFTTHGGVILRVRGTEQAENFWRLSFEVEDTGPGISPEEQSRLFQPFEQTDAGRRAGSGTGLGLAISRNLARLMGGDLTLKSEPGKGSIFRLEIVLRRHEAAGVAPADHAFPVEFKLLVERKPCRVLIVDDVEDNRRLLVELLKPSGFELREANDGLEALVSFSEWAPHLILMDLRMPLMDGTEAIRQIRGQLSGKTVKILALTASAFDENRQALLAIGADDFLGKPFLASDLFGKIRRLLTLEAKRKNTSAQAVIEMVKPKLSLDTISAFRDAANAADLSRLLELVIEQEKEHPDFARELRSLAETFQYDRMLSLVEPNTSAK